MNHSSENVKTCWIFELQNLQPYSDHDFHSKLHLLFSFFSTPPRPLEKPAEVTKKLEDKTSAVGQDISLCCELSKPDVSVRWCKDGKAIRKSQKYDLYQEGTQAVLIIRDSTVKDSGEYTCEAEGSKTKARITVQGQLKHVEGWARIEAGVNIYNLR